MHYRAHMKYIHHSCIYEFVHTLVWWVMFTYHDDQEGGAVVVGVVFRGCRNLHRCHGEHHRGNMRIRGVPCIRDPVVHMHCRMDKYLCVICSDDCILRDLPNMRSRGALYILNRGAHNGLHTVFLPRTFCNTYYWRSWHKEWKENFWTSNCRSIVDWIANVCSFVRSLRFGSTLGLQTCPSTFNRSSFDRE